MPELARILPHALGVTPTLARADPCDPEWLRAVPLHPDARAALVDAVAAVLLQEYDETDSL